MSTTQETILQPSAALLRRRLQEHLADFNDPILAALQGSGLSVLEVALAWVEFEEQAQRAHDDAIATGTIREAQFAQQQKRQEIAQRLIAAKRAGSLP